ncbi:MAG: winged helix-turn-helix transcriptional regulator [Sulfuricella sp.]|nr:winged helix-turn-helix transcriptional regulator [Sulfuricella sp.]
MNELEQHVSQLRQALLEENGDAATREQHWLMGAISTALLQQDQPAMMALRGHLADLAPLADRYATARPGERWRAAWEILHDFTEGIRPLEQARLAEPRNFSGVLLELIGKQPGITPSQLANRTGKQGNHVSNTLRALADQGLVQRVPAGRNSFYHLSAMGSEALQRLQPHSEAPPEENTGTNVLQFPHLNGERLSAANPNRLPGFYPGAGL